MPPFRLRWDVGYVVIDKTVGGLEHLAGARLLQINDQPFEQAIAPFWPGFPANGRNSG